MKLSTTTLFYGPRPDGSVAPMLESIRRIHRAGFRDLDLNFAWTRRHKTELFYQDWREWIQECRSLIGELGMTVSQSHAPFYNVIDPDYPIGKKRRRWCAVLSSLRRSWGPVS